MYTQARIEAVKELYKTDAYGKMLKIRAFEEKAIQLLQEGRLPALVHPSSGQEAAAVGVCSALRRDDYITSTHRGHGHLIAKGGDIRYMFAELFGKKTGYCRGKGGSMHIADVGIGILGATGIVGGGIPIATGAALSAKLRKTDQVAVCFFGDGAANQGTFHESLNLASIWKLPVVYACENNRFGEGTPHSMACAVYDIAVRGVAYGIPGSTVDGMDVVAVYQSAKEAVQRARRGYGPTLLEFKTYRYEGHLTGEEAFGMTGYRTEEELRMWRGRDPITSFRNTLMATDLAAEHDLEQVEREVKGEVEDAVVFALESPDPAPEEALQDLFTV